MFGINFSKYGINSAIFLIIILLLSLVLCSFLGGGNCFNSREGMTSSTSIPEQIPRDYKGTGGSTATLIANVVTTYDSNKTLIETFTGVKSTSSTPTNNSSCSIHNSDCIACVGSTYSGTKCNYNGTYNPYNVDNNYNIETPNKGTTIYKCESTPAGDNMVSITDSAKCPASTSTTATEFTSDTTGNTARLTNKVINTVQSPDPTNSKNIQTTTTTEYTITVSYPTTPPDPTNPSEQTTPKPNDIYTTTSVVVTSDPDPNKSIYVIPRDGSADYSHGSGINYPTTYYANGKTLRVVYANGVYYITVTDPVSGTIYYNSTAATDQASLTKYTFTGTNGGTAVIYKNSNNNNYLAKVTYPDGQVVIYTTTGPTVSSDSEMYNNNTNTYTATTGSSGTAYSGPNATVYTTDTPYTASTGSAAYNSGYNYASSEPQGVSRSNIPEGDEDLYMLKSQIVPPVCPVCPGCGTTNKTVNINSSSNGEKCQPCPACARCPKPAFDCKKVPNYKTIDDSFLPSPVMNTAYSTYGM